MKNNKFLFLLLSGECMKKCVQAFFTDNIYLFWNHLYWPSCPDKLSPCVSLSVSHVQTEILIHIHWMQNLRVLNWYMHLLTLLQADIIFQCCHRSEVGQYWLRKHCCFVNVCEVVNVQYFGRKICGFEDRVDIR